MGSTTQQLNAAPRITGPVFDGLAQVDLDKLQGLFEERHFSPGDLIATRGESAQAFFLLTQGSLLLDMAGGKSLVLDQAGDFLAMELLSARGIYTASLTGLEKGRLLAIPRTDFLDVIQQDSPAAEMIMARWQAFLDRTAPFAKILEDTDLERF